MSLSSSENVRIVENTKNDKPIPSLIASCKRLSHQDEQVMSSVVVWLEIPIGALSSTTTDQNTNDGTATKPGK